MAYRPIISVDFDGVIHSYSSGWSKKRFASARIADDPVPGAIEALLAYLDAGYVVAIFSSRSKTPWGRWAMKRWLAKHLAAHWEGGNTPPSMAEVECWGDAAAVVKCFSWPWFKPSAVLTIDDRAVCFGGQFPSPDYIRSFQPWNKRKKPTLAELEALLARDDRVVHITPDGKVIW